MLKNCIIKAVGVNSDEYHNQKVEDRGKPSFIMSPSSLKDFRRNPHKWFKGYVPPESASKDYGNLLDCLVLSPNLFDKRYIVIPKTYTSKGMKCPKCGSVTDSNRCRECKTDREETEIEKDWASASNTCQKWLEEKTKLGLKPIYESQLTEAQLAAKTLFEDETCSELIKCSRTQVHVVGEWHDEKTGLVIPVQCLIDGEPDKASTFQKALWDLKTSRNAEQETFLWDAYRNGYHIQAAFDLDMHNVATRTNPKDKFSSEGRLEWFFLVQENFAPFEVGRRSLSEKFIEIGQRTYMDALARYARCVKTGIWPGYDNAEEFSLMIPFPKMEFEALEDKLEADAAEAMEESGDVPS